jgi:hypothetical protein
MQRMDVSHECMEGGGTPPECEAVADEFLEACIADCQEGGPGE